MSNAKAHLRALITEYLILDDHVPEDKILELLIDAVTKPTRDQPLVVQQHIKGTHAHKLYHTPTTALTKNDQHFLDTVDNFRTKAL